MSRLRMELRPDYSLVIAQTIVFDFQLWTSTYMLSKLNSSFISVIMFQSRKITWNIEPHTRG